MLAPEENLVMYMLTESANVANTWDEVAHAPGYVILCNNASFLCRLLAVSMLAVSQVFA